MERRPVPIGCDAHDPTRTLRKNFFCDAQCYFFFFRARLAEMAAFTSHGRLRGRGARPPGRASPWPLASAGGVVAYAKRRVREPDLETCLPRARGRRR